MSTNLLKVVVIYFYCCCGLISCRNDGPYHFSNDSYSGSFLLENGFQIDKLTVDSVAEFDIGEKVDVDSLGNIISQPKIRKGFPLRFKVDTTVILSTQRDSRFIPQKRIYFNKENQGYYWFFSDSKVNTRHSVLPIKFMPDSWYRFRGLPSKWGDNDYKVFIYVNQGMKFLVFEDYNPGPF